MNSHTHRFKVLIVEDSKEVSSTIEKNLSMVKGIECKELGGNVGSASFQIIQENPDILILDFKLEDGTGLDILRNIGSCRESIKIIVFTNYYVEELKRQCSLHGADYFLDKSFEMDQLIDLIKLHGFSSN